jgi:hypothetical protein
MRCFTHNATHHGDAPVQAAYSWQAPNGNVIPLCAECCAAWRANCATIFADDPAMQPVQITSIRPNQRMIRP